MGFNKEDRERQKQERLGEVGYNTYGSKMTIIKYNSIRDITVQFDNGYIVDSEYQCFQKGTIRNPYDKTVYGIGYLGEGKYKPKINGVMTKEYEKWFDMMKRCYSEISLKNNPTYVGCSVDPIWHNFQNFGEFFTNNYYEIEGQRIALDKDIIHKGNKVYSCENCVFVSQDINSLFNKHKATRGKYPIGVCYNNGRGKRYTAKYSNGSGKSISLGNYDTIEEAFWVYKKHKEKLIKSIANKYKSQIPERLYNAMMVYKIDITD